MGNPLSPVLANISWLNWSQMLSDPLTHNPITGTLMIVSSKRRKIKRDKPDDLLERLNNYHPNIVFTVEENSDHFLDTASTYDNQVYKKPGKLPTHWKSEIKLPQNRKLIASLAPSTGPNVSLRILTTKSKKLKKTYLIAGYPTRFICQTVNSFLNDSPVDKNTRKNTRRTQESFH